jgi:hypothetical protein
MYSWRALLTAPVCIAPAVRASRLSAGFSALTCTPAPRLKIKIVRDHWKMSFQEFDAAIRAAHPEVSGAQIKELKEELRAIKEEKGIEIKRGRPAATVEDAKIVRETPREKKPAAAVETPIKKIKNRAPKLDDSLTNF